MGKNIPSHGTLDSIIQRFVRQFNMADETCETSHPVHGKMTDFRADAFYSQRLGKTVWTERKIQNETEGCFPIVFLKLIAN